MTRTTGQSESEQFVAPEFLGKSAPNYKYKVDVYAVGMVMYYMATAIEWYAKNPNERWNYKRAKENKDN